MSIRKFKIVTAKKYFKDNQEKTLWQNVGVMTEFIKEDGSVSRKIEIPAIGLDAQVFPFEDKKEDRYNAQEGQPQPTGTLYRAKAMTPEEEYNQYGSKTEMVDEVIDSSEIPY